MGRQPTGPFGGSLMTPQGRGVVGVKADQRGCGAGGQDRAHKSSPFSEEAIFFRLPSELKYNHNRHIVLPPACKGYNSNLADRTGRLGWVVVDFWKVNRVVYFRLNENCCSGGCGKMSSHRSMY